MIASGTWLNVRVFPKGKFFEADEDTTSRRKSWYYCPQALSEYQVSFLGIAHKLGILNDLKSDAIFDSDYTNILFSGTDPTLVYYNETDSFKHYLQCLKIQTINSCKDSFDNTFNTLKLQLKTSQELTEYFISKGVRGKNRDFSNVVDSSISSIDAYKNIRGLIYSQKWNNI